MSSTQRLSSPTTNEIAQAMERDELVLYYQPKVCLLRGIVVGAEALVRWNDPHSRVLSPSVFLPQIEASGLLHDLTVRLLDDVVGACAVVRDLNADIALSINVAPNDLASRSISSRIHSYLNGGSITANELQIEITESTVMGNFDVVRDELGALTSMGLRVLMDDFGTGHSSIDRLSQLPFSSLKLDQGVVRRMSTSAQNLNVVRSAISMARELGMTSIAEGVESVGAPAFLGSQIGYVHQALFNLLRYRKSLMDVVVCSALDAGSVAPSIKNVHFSDDDQLSAVVDWFYGIGQSLSQHNTFLALEAPLLDLQKLGSKLQHDMATDQSPHNLNDSLDDIDRCVNDIVAHIHRLERTLLRNLSSAEA